MWFKCLLEQTKSNEPSEKGRVASVASDTQIEKCLVMEPIWSLFCQADPSPTETSGKATIAAKIFAIEQRVLCRPNEELLPLELFRINSKSPIKHNCEIYCVGLQTTSNIPQSRTQEADCWHSALNMNQSMTKWSTQQEHCCRDEQVQELASLCLIGDTGWLGNQSLKELCWGILNAKPSSWNAPNVVITKAADQSLQC